VVATDPKAGGAACPAGVRDRSVVRGVRRPRAGRSGSSVRTAGGQRGRVLAEKGRIGRELFSTLRGTATVARSGHVINVLTEATPSGSWPPSIRAPQRHRHGHHRPRLPHCWSAGVRDHDGDSWLSQRAPQGY